jgi:uncharacterized protein (UPF0332 family)
MRHLFVGKGLLKDILVDDMDDARALREDADYRADFSETGAHHNLEAAKRFIARAIELLSEWEETSEGETEGDASPAIG